MNFHYLQLPGQLENVNNQENKEKTIEIEIRIIVASNYKVNT